MKALWFESGRMEMRDIPAPAPKPGEALVDVLAVGLCDTDLELTKGYMNFRGVPGHEFVGRVAAGAPELQGRRVVGEINIGCGTCAFCAKGLTRHCPNREVLGILNRQGAFASQLALPVSNLHLLPESVDILTGVFVEPLAAALRITEQVRIALGTKAILIGDGKLAQLIARVMALYDVGLVVVGRHPEKLSLIAPFAESTYLEKEYEVQRRFGLAIEASGGPQGLSLAARSLEPQGTLILKSTYAGQAQIDLNPFVVDEITLVGSRCGPFAPALDLLARGMVDVKPLVTAVFPFADALKAFERAFAPDALKVVVELSG